MMERLEDCQMTLGPMATNRYRCHHVPRGMRWKLYVLILHLTQSSPTVNEAGAQEWDSMIVTSAFS